MTEPKTKPEPEPRRRPESPIERTRRELEARGFPEGVDYEALILAEQEEAEEPIW